MEKVVCNTYYNVNLNVHYRMSGDKIYNLGNFASEQDAQMALELFRVAWYYTKEETPISYIGTHDKIEKFYKPENEKIDYYKTTKEFMASNPYFVRYLKRHDPQLLEQIKKQVEVENLQPQGE